MPPYTAKCFVLAGCQSRVLKTGSPRSRKTLINLLSAGTTASPFATARDPPGQKSFCTSTTISAFRFSSDISTPQERLESRFRASRLQNPALRLVRPRKRCNKRQLQAPQLLLTLDEFLDRSISA